MERLHTSFTSFVASVGARAMRTSALASRHTSNLALPAGRRAASTVTTTRLAPAPLHAPDEHKAAGDVEKGDHQPAERARRDGRAPYAVRDKQARRLACFLPVLCGGQCRVAVWVRRSAQRAHKGPAEHGRCALRWQANVKQHGAKTRLPQASTCGMCRFPEACGCTER